MVYLNLIDTAHNSYPTGTILLPAAEYTPFSIPVTYPAGVKIAEVSIIVSTTIYFMQGDGGNGEIGSVLYLDDLDLVNPCEEYPPYSIASVQIPTCEDTAVDIDAGDGWAEYLWSTGETTQTISVPVNVPETYSVTVTAATTGCQFSDWVTGPILICDAVDENIEKATALNVYPNPSSGVFTVEFTNALPGSYMAEIITVTGKVVFKEDLYMNQANKKVKFSLSGLPEGLYLIKVSGERLFYAERLMIK